MAEIRGPFDPQVFDCTDPVTMGQTVFDRRGGPGTREGVRWCHTCRAPVVLDTRPGLLHPHFAPDQAQT